MVNFIGMIIDVLAGLVLERKHMNIKSVSKLGVFIFLVIPCLLFAESYSSKYKGEELRKIKTLSQDDISELQKGGGWGLAKAAELNGYPGPLHILQMESEISLTPKQKNKIQELYREMNSRAVVLGQELIDLEGKLNTAFAEREIDNESLEEYINAIEAIRSSLRMVHLSAHLETPNILSEAQITLYNQLRGYSSNDPCKNIPKGHNATMWKMHNGCN